MAVELDATQWPLLPVFAWLAGLSNLSDHEMGRTFNCGIGMVMVVSPENAPAVEAYLKEQNYPYYQIGKVIPRAANSEQVLINNTTTAWKRL